MYGNEQCLVELRLFCTETRERVEIKGRKRVTVPVEEEVTFSQWFNKKDLGTVGEYVSAGTVDPRKSVVYDKESNRFYNTCHPVETILKIKNVAKNSPIGFHAHRKS